MKLVIFDCDGTLVDSQHMIAASMEAAYERCGLTWPGRSRTLSIVGLSLPQAFAVLAPDEEQDVRDGLADAYRQAFFELRQDPAHHEPMFDGAHEAIETLAGRDDVVLGIATGKSKRGVRAVLDREGFLDVFATVQTADDAPSKPHPAMVHQAMQETGAAAEDTVVVGDTSFDILMARAAGTAAIGVSWGYHPAQSLSDAGAHVVLDHFNELSAELAAIWGG